MKKYNDVTLMVLTCDKNEDIWSTFFSMLKRNWPEFDGEIFINTERKQYQDSLYNVRRSQQQFSEYTPWSLRLKTCLKEVNTKYVIFLLEDFILSENVDDKEVLRTLSIMEKDNSIACFNYMETYKDAEDSLGESYGNYYLKSQKAEFRINLQAALWRKDFLLKFIRNHENPWQFETWGNLRARRYGDKIFHIKKGAKRVFSYPEGGILADGRWRNDSSVEFLKKIGAEIDISIRDIYYDGDIRKTEIVHRTFLTKCWQVFKSLI
jgi:hypothetical protein